MNNPLNNGKITRTTIIVFAIVTLIVVGVVAAAVNYSLQTSEPKTVTGVNPVNAAPVINSYLPVSITPSVADGVNLTFSVSASDPEGQPLTYIWTLDSSPQSTSASYNFLGTSAPHVVKVTVSDGNSDASITWTVSVADSDVFISVTLTVSSTSVIRDANHYLTLTGTIIDPHGNGLIMKFYQNGNFIGQKYISNLQADITIVGDTLATGANVFTAGP